MSGQLEHDPNLGIVHQGSAIVAEKGGELGVEVEPPPPGLGNSQVADSGLDRGLQRCQRSGPIRRIEAGVPAVTSGREVGGDLRRDLQEFGVASAHDRNLASVWNDPVNLMAYVTYVFQKLFGYDRATAHRLMLAVHHEGKAVVSSGNREEMERDVTRLHAYGLWATLQQDS